MKVFSELKTVLGNLKNLYKSLPLNERNTFLDNYNSNGSILHLIELMKALDVSITGAKSIEKERLFSSGEVDYSNLLDDPEHLFNVGVFFIPKGLNLPPHDHPNMLVISKVLEGSIQMISMDEVASLKKRQEIEVKVIQNNILKKDEIDILTPNKKNYHYILARENTIFLDIFIPHYDDIYRVCNFYDLKEKNKQLVLIKNNYI